MKVNAILESVKTFRAKRLGRGIGSGKGKTCGRGVKGQKSRSGVSVGLLEGGQQPFSRALPKRGFKPFKKRYYNLISLDKLHQLMIAGLIDSSLELTKEMMFKLNLISKKNALVKILSSKLDKEFNFSGFKCEYDKISNAAREILQPI